MANSVKINYLFNLINSGSQLLFPLITFPYASRIMLADGIGHVSFFQSIISYISLFTCLGIPMYAIREVAKVRNNAVEMTRTTVEILLLHAFLSILGYVVVAVICMTVTQVQADIPLFLLLSTTIFFTAIGCEWFYQGIEDFKYVAVRGVLVKLISVVLLFFLVKTKEDILWYGAYSVLGILGGNIFNFIRLRKYLSRDVIDFRTLHPLKHLKPALHVFALNVIISIYIQMNNVLLGFMKDAEAVGYFTAATKLMVMAMSILGSLGNVMMPHISNLIAVGRMDESKALIQKSYDLVLALAMPLTVGLIFTSPSAILLLSGMDFIPAILTSQIVAFNILMVGLSGVMGIQVLYPLGKINIVILSTFIGAITNVLLNILLVPRYGHNGTAIAYMLAEAAVTISMFFIGHKYIPVQFLKKQHLHYIGGCIVMGGCLHFISLFDLSYINTLIAMISVGGMVYVIVLLLLKDSIGKTIWETMRTVLIKK
ncbi:flippase [Phocaeicola vulgatus]|uniref:flippase n=1 Tax=Phocaeicola vulgatus TaxID=821 RepID=UPI0023074CF3|nr:flippase [uncultured Phocaeicola sp.]MDB0838988.1 flippase [Phocaeicola vulgatus]MDB0856027.1 flippase [Phocaeicola vulgatus]MDB0860012.1 flippase [Phocaeicola vulgatus]MDB0866476.1 flippase [Phocaeicola vulgatus]MDB0868696.1 flippase [Phocaeicola vulgatus]